MTKAEFLKMDIELSIRAERELKKFSDDEELPERFFISHHIDLYKNPDMVAWQKYNAAQRAVDSIRRASEYTLDDFFASGGMLPEEEDWRKDEVVQKLYKEMEENREGWLRWERATNPYMRTR